MEFSNTEELKMIALEASISRYEYLIENKIKLYSSQDMEFCKIITNEFIPIDRSIFSIDGCPCCYVNDTLTKVRIKKTNLECHYCYIKDAIRNGIIESIRNRVCLASFYTDKNRLENVLTDLIKVKKWISTRDLIDIKGE